MESATKLCFWVFRGMFAVQLFTYTTAQAAVTKGPLSDEIEVLIISKGLRSSSAAIGYCRGRIQRSG